MAVTDSFLAYVLEQLAGLGRLRSRRMFGAVGLYSGDVFFAIVSRNVVYLKVDETTRGDFVDRGMGPFRPFADRPEASIAYYQVPADVIEDADSLAEWARKAVRVGASARLILGSGPLSGIMPAACC